MPPPEFDPTIHRVPVAVSEGMVSAVPSSVPFTNNFIGPSLVATAAT